MPLTESQAKNAKPREQAYKLADAGGLFLLVQPNGARLWRLKYRYGGKKKLLSFGADHDVGIAAARDKRTVAKAILAEGRDPMKNKSEIDPSKSEAFRVIGWCPWTWCSLGVGWPPWFSIRFGLEDSNLKEGTTMTDPMMHHVQGHHHRRNAGLHVKRELV
jgi:hypothetical protein